MSDQKRNLRLVICGGRLFGQQPGELALLNTTLDRIHRERTISLIIHGGAAGADNHAQRWCESRGVPVQAVIANWYHEGRAAGPIRNQKMVDESRADGLIKFPGGAGTEDCARRARAAGIPVWEIRMR